MRCQIKDLNNLPYHSECVWLAHCDLFCNFFVMCFGAAHEHRKKHKKAALLLVYELHGSTCQKKVTAYTLEIKVFGQVQCYRTIYCLLRFYSCLKFKSKMHLEPLKKLDKPCTALCNIKTILLSGEYGCDFRYKAAVTQRSLFHPRQYCSVGQRYRLMWLGNKR